MQKEPIHQALNDAWRSAESTAVLYFLRRAIAPDSTLQQIQAALAFEPVRAHLQAIRLAEVLAGSALAQADAGASAADAKNSGERGDKRVGRPATKAAAPVKRQRRSAEEINVIKEILLTRLQQVPAGIDTPRLTELVCEAGHTIDTMKINLLLNTMQNAGQVSSNDGRPKTWRAKTQGRVAAEPMVIKKAQPHGTSPAQNDQSTELLSQAEIHSAAAALRERFFAS